MARKVVSERRTSDKAIREIAKRFSERIHEPKNGGSTLPRFVALLDDLAKNHEPHGLVALDTDDVNRG